MNTMHRLSAGFKPGTSSALHGLCRRRQCMQPATRDTGQLMALFHVFRQTGVPVEFTTSAGRTRFAFSWSIPKGLYEGDEDPFVAAKREFEEETGLLPEGKFFELGTFRQPGGKIITAWAVNGEFAPANLKSNFFSLEWPPKSGRIQDYPEVDRAGWFNVAGAMRKILKGQAPILQALRSRLEKAR